MRNRSGSDLEGLLGRRVDMEGLGAFGRPRGSIRACSTTRFRALPACLLWIGGVAQISTEYSQQAGHVVSLHPQQHFARFGGAAALRYTLGNSVATAVAGVNYFDKSVWV